MSEPLEVPRPKLFDPELLQVLMIDLGDDVDIGPYVEEYEKLQQALRKSHQQVNRLQTKCENLAKAIKQREKVYADTSAAHEKQEQKKQELQDEIEINKKAKAEMLAKAEEKKGQVAGALHAINELDIMLQADTNEAIEAQKREIEALQAQLDQLGIESDNKKAILAQERAENADLNKQLQECNEKRRKGQQEIEKMEQSIQDTNALVGKSTRKKAEVDAEVKLLNTELKTRDRERVDKRDKIVHGKKDLLDKEKRLQEQDELLNRNEEHLKRLEGHFGNMEKELKSYELDYEAAHRNEIKTHAELEAEKKRCAEAKKTAEAKRKLTDVWMRKHLRMESEKKDAEAEKTKQTKFRTEMKKRTNRWQKKLNTASKQIDTCVREREVLGQNHMAKLEATKKQEIALKIKRSTLKNIWNEHRGRLVNIRNLRKMIDKLRRDTASHQNDIHRRTLQLERAKVEVEEREQKIGEYQQKILENEQKLRNQQTLLDTVTSDHKFYRKLLIEQKHDLVDNNNTFKSLQHQIGQLKSEIADKDISFVTEHFNLEHVQADIDDHKEKNNACDNKLGSTDEMIRKQAGEIRKLSTIIADADEELRVQTKQYNTVVNEQRVLNQQLITRNEELAGLYEELKLQNSLLRKGKEQWREQRMLFNKLLETEKILGDQLEKVNADCEKYDELKQTIGHLHAELIEEQLKVKALTDELAKPINIHRWRRLQDTNADSYGMMKRVRRLQKSIIRKGAQLTQKDDSIQSKEQLYVDLRKVLARQPGSEAAEQYRMYLKTLKKKRAAFKTLKAELKMYQAKVHEYKYEVQQLENDIQMVNLEYFDRQRMLLRQGGLSGATSNRSSRPVSSHPSNTSSHPSAHASRPGSSARITGANSGRDKQHELGSGMGATAPSDYRPPSNPFGGAPDRDYRPPSNPFGAAPGALAEHDEDTAYTAADTTDAGQS